MTPKERLIENIIDLVHARTGHAYDEALGDLLEATLKTHYAIGRWVPVEERLPEFDWCGFILTPDNRITFTTGDAPYLVDMGDTVSIAEYPGATHWLELNMPSGKGEA